MTLLSYRTGTRWKDLFPVICCVGTAHLPYLFTILCIWKQQIFFGQPLTKAF
jgi:hypothetical protein